MRSSFVQTFPLLVLCNLSLVFFTTCLRCLLEPWVDNQFACLVGICQSESSPFYSICHFACSLFIEAKMIVSQNAFRMMRKKDISSYKRRNSTCSHFAALEQLHKLQVSLLHGAHTSTCIMTHLEKSIQSRSKWIFKYIALFAFIWLKIASQHSAKESLLQYSFVSMTHGLIPRKAHVPHVFCSSYQSSSETYSCRQYSWSEKADLNLNLRNGFSRKRTRTMKPSPYSGMRNSIKPTFCEAVNLYIGTRMPQYSRYRLCLGLA